MTSKFPKNDPIEDFIKIKMFLLTEVNQVTNSI